MEEDENVSSCLLVVTSALTSQQHVKFKTPVTELKSPQPRVLVQTLPVLLAPQCSRQPLLTPRCTPGAAANTPTRPRVLAASVRWAWLPPLCTHRNPSSETLRSCQATCFTDGHSWTGRGLPSHPRHQHRTGQPDHWRTSKLPALPCCPSLSQLTCSWPVTLLLKNSSGACTAQAPPPSLCPAAVVVLS